jgi:hypothetical protein
MSTIKMEILEEYLRMATEVACIEGRESLAMVQALGYRFVTANIRGLLGVIPCQICGG